MTNKNLVLSFIGIAVAIFCTGVLSESGGISNGLFDGLFTLEIVAMWIAIIWMMIRLWRTK